MLNDPEVNFDQFAADHYGSKPHPSSQSGITVRDWSTAVMLTNATKFGGGGGHAEPHEVDLFWPQFQAMAMPPAQFMELLDRLAQWSFRYHNRPPTLPEIQALKDQKPGDQHKHYQDLPDEHYPDVSAHEMVKSLAKADPYAKQHLGRGAIKTEARFVHHAALSAGQIDEHYRGLAADREQKMAPKQPAEAF